MEKKNEFANILLMFGRSPIAIYATCFAPFYSKFNAESNLHIRLVKRWRESNELALSI